PERLHFLQDAEALGHGEEAVDVDEQVARRSQNTARCLAALDRHANLPRPFRSRVSDQPIERSHLDGVEAIRDGALDRAGKSVGRAISGHPVDVRILTNVRTQPAAEELVARNAEHLALEIPQRLLNSTDRHNRRATVRGDMRPAPLPQFLEGEDAASLQGALVLLEQRQDLEVVAALRTVAETGHSFRRINAQQNPVSAPVDLDAKDLETIDR